MIEGQPQHFPPHRVYVEHISGLVIEGQPQQHWHLMIDAAHISGLVIEGQPQRFAGANWKVM